MSQEVDQARFFFQGDTCPCSIMWKNSKRPLLMCVILETMLSLGPAEVQPIAYPCCNVTLSVFSVASGLRATNCELQNNIVTLLVSWVDVPQQK